MDCRGFVQEQYSRSPHGRDSDRETPLHTATEGASLVVSVCGQGYTSEDLVTVCLNFGNSFESSVQPQMLSCCELWKQHIVLRTHTRDLLQLLLIALHVEPKDKDFPISGCVSARQALD